MPMTKPDEGRISTLLNIIVRAGEIQDNPKLYNRMPSEDALEKVRKMQDYCYEELDKILDAMSKP